MRALRLFFGYLVIGTIFGFSCAFADWPSRTDSAVSVAAVAGNQWNSHLISDGDHGAIVVWQDRRSGFDKIYVQRLNSSGVPQWQSGGLQLATSLGYQYYPQAISDGKRGMFVTWQDNRSGLDYDIFAQRIGPDGTSLWTVNGVGVCTATGHQYNPQLVPDGSGGIIVTWQDRRTGGFDIFAQRLSAGGKAMWGANGVSVCNANLDQIEPKLIPDGMGGAIITWLDYRGGSGFTDIFIQHIFGNGSPDWTSNGVPVCIAPNVQWNAQILSDGSGKSIVVWQDRRTGNNDNIFAQKINGLGNPEWTADGVALAPIPGTQYYPQAVTDHNGGAVVVWQDNRTGSDYNIVGQRISTNGQLLWPAPGVTICGTTGHQYNPAIVTQGSDYLVTWQDKRGLDFDVYAQRFRNNAEMLWQTDGVVINSLPNDQFMPQLVGDGANGAIIAWSDYHLGNGSTDLFAQRVGANGLNAGGNFRTIGQDGFALKGVLIKDRRVPHEIIGMPNEGNVRDSIFGRGAFSQGLVLGIERFDSNRAYGWEYFTKSVYVRRALPQHGEARGLDRVYDHVFRGLMKNPPIWRYNNAVSGELLTLKLNIAASDAGITPLHLGEIVFHDTASTGNILNDLSLRQIGKKVDSLLTYWKRYTANYPQIASSLSKINNAFVSSMDTLSTGPLQLTAPKSMFSVSYLVPGVEIPPPPPTFTPTPDAIDEPTRFALDQNYPNPFNPITTIEFTLPEQARVTLRVFNILGQEVARLIDNATLDDGRQVIDFDATRLSSGVYFYQLAAEPVSPLGKMITQTRKMILVK